MSAAKVDSDEAQSCAANARPVAMVISKQRVTGPNNGSSAYLLALSQSIKDAGYDVWLIQPSADLAGRTPILRFSQDLDVFARHEILGMERVGRMAVSLSPAVWWGFMTGGAKLVARKLLGDRKFLADRPRPYSIARPWKLNEHGSIQYFAEQAGPDLKLAVADYIFCAEAFADVPQDATTAIIMHDLFSQRDGKGADSVAEVSEAQETALLGQADWVIAIQTEERDFVASACRGSEAILAAMPADITHEAQAGLDDRLLFIGSDTAPNSVGLEWFCENVWPLVRQARPEAQLDVIGTVARKFDTKSYEGVQFLGLVDDLALHYQRAGVLISPLTFGSGLKIKLVEAMGQGKAVVATPTTLQGVEDICSAAVVCHEDPAAMAEAIIELAGNAEALEDLANAALTCAKTHFSASSVHAEFKAKLEELRVS